MTDAEKLGMKKLGGQFGLWNASTFFLPMACLFFIPIPVPLNWIAAAGGLMIGLAFYPFWWRRMANQLCATAWAKERGYNPATLRIFPFGSTGIMLLGVVLLLIMAVCWWQTYRPEGVWLPWLAPASIKEAGGGPSIRVTDVSQHGQTVLVRIVCDQIPHGGELAPVFAGPLIELPYILPAAVTNVDCLLMAAPHTYTGKTIVGTNVLSGKPDFLLGFMLPDDQAAAAAVKQVQKLNLGKRHRVDSPLFILRRNLGKDANGKPLFEEIVCWIGMQAKSSPRKSKTAAPNLSFGPVMERVVNGAIDFDSGRMGAVPVDKSGKEGLERVLANLKNFQQAGWDFMQDPEIPGAIMAVDMKILPFDAAAWDNLSSKDLTVRIRDAAELQLNDFSPLPNLPATYGFKTRESGMGLLQITGFTDHPRGVRIRYKLVQNGMANATVNPGDAIPATNGVK